MSKSTRDDSRSAPEPLAGEASSPSPGPELRLVDRKAFVGLGDFDVAPGVRIADLTLQIPNVSFPINLSGGAARYQKQRCLFGQLDLELAPALVKSAEAQLLKNAPELSRLRLNLRSGFVEVEGAVRTSGNEPVPFTARIAFDGAGEGVAARAFDVRLYAPCELPAPLIANVLAQAAARARLAPELAPRGFGAVAASPLGDLLRRTVPQKGFRLPETSAARLGSALVSPQGITLRFSAGAPPPGGLADEELLLAVEGAHAFEEGERLLEAGELQRAREFFLREGELAQAHPFATERLIALLLVQPEISDYALDLVRALQSRRPLSPAPLWMEALIRLARGEQPLAAKRYLDLAAMARGRGEEASAFWAAQAAARIAGASDDPSQAKLAVRALHESLGLRPDHLPSLQALASEAERAGDDVAALRAYRRLTAVAKDAVEAARAHVRLGELCARVEQDLAGARLHYDAALRLQPDDADALLGLADLCARSGEPLRALRSLDRVRELHPKDARLFARAELEAGAVYEHALNQAENARLRYLEAARALPGEAEPLVRIGRVDERLGRVPEAIEVLSQALELLGDAKGHLAHEAHRLLAAISRDRLHDGAKQREHLEAAVAARPDDAEAWEELVPLFRADEAHGPLAEALARAAARLDDPRRRAAMLVESAELLRLRLGQPEAARVRYQEALAVEPKNKAALEGILGLEELAGEMGAACERLRTLLELAPPGPARLPLLRRLAAAARDGKKDLDLAAKTTREILALAPDDLASLSDLVTLQRRRGDLPGLAEALEGWARGSEKQGDAATTSAALRELAALYEARLGRRDEAISALEKAHALAPADLGVLGDLAELSLRAGRHRLARFATRALLGLLPPEGAPDAPAVQRRAELHERLSRAAEAAGDLTEATAALEEAYRLAPDEAFADRLDGLYALARRDEARIELARRRGAALARGGKGPQAAQVLAQAASLSRSLGDLGGAMRDFTAALAADPTGAGALANLDALADLAVAAGQPGEAAGHLAKRSALTAEPRAAAKLLLRAAQLCFGIDEPRALSLLASAAARDGRFGPARAALAERRARAGDLGAAWREAEAALEIDAADPDAIDAAAQASLERNAARWAEQSGDAAAAARFLGRYLVRRPEDADALHARVSLLRNLGDAPALASALEQLESRTAGSAAVAVARELANLYEHGLRRLDLAANAFRRILRADPEDREALTALARLLGGPSEVDERVEVLGRLARLARDGEEAAQLQLQRGEALRGGMRFAEAARAFAEAAQSAPDARPALDLLIASAEEAGQSQVALAARRDRAELFARRGEPNAAEALLDVASRFLAAESYDDARAALNRLLALGPAKELACAAHARLAEVGRARGDLREVLTSQLALAALVEGADRLAALREAADAAVALEDLPAARDALLGAAALAPRELQVVRALAEVQRRLGDGEGEAETLAALAKLEEGPAAAESWVRAANLLRQAGHAARAESALRSALVLAPERAAVRGPLLELVLARGEFAEAAALLEAGAAHEADPAGAARALLRAAAIHQDKLASRIEALRLTRAAFARAPELAEAIAALAERSYLAGAGEEAAPLLARTLELIDGRAEPDRWVSLALAYAELRAEQGQPALATESLARAAELAPWRADVARALYQAERTVDPRAALERLCKGLSAMHPGSHTHALRIEAADGAQALGDGALAVRLLEQALETAAQDRPALESRLIALQLEQGQVRGAVALLRAQAERIRTERGDLQTALAQLAHAAELLERAQDAEAAVGIWNEIAQAEIAAGRAAAAARALVRAGGLHWHVTNRLDAAELDLRRAIELDPEGLEAVRLCQQVAQARGDAQGLAELLSIEDGRLQDGALRARVLLRRAELERGSLRDPARAEGSLKAALALEPSLAEARDLYEELLRAAGRQGELAHSLLARAAGAAPGAAVAYLREAAHLFGESGNAAAAADALDQARSLAPEDEGVALAAAEGLARAGREDEAALIDTALLARSPAREPSFSRELSRREKLGDVHGQAALFEARALAEPADAAAPRFLEAARRYDQAGEAEAARRCELWAFERAPQDAEAFERVVARNQAESQLRVLDGILRRRAQAVEDEAAALHLRRARLLADHEELDDARAALDEAISQGAESQHAALEALVLRADLEARLSGPAAAARFDERLVSRDDLDPAARLRILCRLAETRAGAGRDADAAALWEAALGLGAGESAIELYEKLSAVYARLGDPGKQAEVLLARAEAVPSERTALLRAAAELAGDGPVARKALALLAEGGGDAGSLLKLARLELADAEPRGRERLVEAARAALVPSVQADLLLEAAEIFAQAGDPTRARGLRAEARRADPNHLEALRAAARDAEPSERQEILANLVELEPDPFRRAAHRRELAELLEQSDPAAAHAQWVSWAQLAEPEARPAAWREVELRARKSGAPARLAEALEQRASIEPEGAGPLWLEAARAWQTAEQPQRARAALHRAAAAAPESAEALRGLVELATASGDQGELARAEESLAGRLEGAARAEALHRAALAWKAANRAEAALVALREAVALAPSQSAWQRELAETALGLERHDLAQEALLAAAELAEPAERASLLRRAAQLAESRGDPAAAISCWRTLWAQDHGDTEAFERLSGLLAARQDRTALAQLFTERAQAAGLEATGAIWSAAARAWEDAGSRSAALRTWTAAHAARPDDLEISRALLQSAEAARKPEAQLEALAALGRLEPEATARGDALERLASLHQAQGDSAAALGALRRAFEAEPDSPARREKLVDALESAGELAEAAQRLGTIVDAPVESVVRRAGLLARAGQVREAAEALLAKLSMHPGQVELARAFTGLSLEPADRAALLPQFAGLAPQADRAALLLELAASSEGEARRPALQRAFEADPAGPAFEALRDLFVEADDDLALAELLDARAAALPDARERAQVLMELGELYEGSLHALPEAFDAYERSLVAFPENPGVKRDLAELAFELGRDARAQELYAGLLAGGDPSLWPLLLERLAALASRGGDSAKALEHLEARVALGPSPELWRQIRELARTTKNRRTELRALGGLAESDAPVAERIGALRELVGLEILAGATGIALEHQVQVVALAPDDLEAFRSLRELARAEQDQARELLAVERLLELEPEAAARAEVQLDRARLLADRGELEEAARAALTAHGLAPSDEALRVALTYAHEAGLNEVIEQAGLALYERLGLEAVVPFAKPLGLSLASRGAWNAALPLLRAARESEASDAQVDAALFEAIEHAGSLDERISAAREVALQNRDGAKLRELGALAEGEGEDLALAAELYDEAFSFAPARDAELEAHAARLASLHRGREAALARAELARRLPSEPARWMAMANAAREANVEPLLRAADAIDAFLAGALPELPTELAPSGELRASLLAAIPAAWLTALTEASKARWSELAPAPSTLRPGGPVLLNRIGALADALGIARPSVRMNPAAASVSYAGPDALVVGIGLFSLPARAQDYVLALALARAHLALPFIDATVLEGLGASGVAPTLETLEAAAEALAAAVVDDGLGVLAGCTAVDPAFAHSDPRAWDRAAALQGPALRGASALLAAALARLGA